MDTKERIIKIINKIVDKIDGKVQVNNETNLICDCGFDSIQLIQLIVMVEDEFDIEIEDDELEMHNISIVGNLVNIVEKK